MPHAASGSPSNLWWAADVGPCRVVTLCSYCSTAAGSLQLAWLERELAAVDRRRTPWLVVMMHVPWYSSHEQHWREAELGRLDAEPLLYEAGVDLVLSGHLHAYERSHPAFNGTANRCGPTYLNLGDGGNREGAPPGRYFEPAPDWSAFREASFGIGSLVLHNATHAELSWHRSACEVAGRPSNIDFDEGCSTVVWGPGGHSDNSEMPTRRSDSTWLVRPAVRIHPSADGCTPPDGGWRGAAERAGVEEVEEVAREGAPTVAAVSATWAPPVGVGSALLAAAVLLGAAGGVAVTLAAGAVRAAAAARRRRPRAPPSVGWSAPYVRVEE